MKAQKVAAKFAAYVWFENHEGDASEDVKTRFANANWKAFLPIANEGLGRLLLKIGAGRSRKREQLALAVC